MQMCPTNQVGISTTRNDSPKDTSGARHRLTGNVCSPDTPWEASRPAT